MEPALPGYVKVIDYFAPGVLADRARRPPPAGWPGWTRYDNPTEGSKRTTRDLGYPGFADLFHWLTGPQCVGRVEALTRVWNLEADPTLHGGGIHVSGPGDRLEPHVDYSIHPLRHLERRANLVLFLTPDWRPEWGGALEFYGEDGRTVIGSVLPAYNRAVLFEPTEWGDEPLRFHGTQAVACPAGVERVTAAAYYLSAPRPDGPRRLRALFAPRRDR